MKRKAQAQIIVTVLIILIVLGIIAFVGTFLTKTVRKGTEQAGTRVNCININLEINEAVNGSPISVSRSLGGEGDVSVNVYIDEAFNETIYPAPELETFVGTTTLSTGQEVQIAANINGTLCDFADSATVA